MNKTVKKALKVLKPSVKSMAVVLTKEEAMEKISNLRMISTHFTIESVSVSILSLLLFIGAPSVFPEIINPYLPSSLKIMQALVAVPAVFWVLTLLGNIVRMWKIMKLQKTIFS